MVRGFLVRDVLLSEHDSYEAVNFFSYGWQARCYCLSLLCEAVGSAVSVPDAFYPFFPFHRGEVAVDHAGAYRDSEFARKITAYPVARHSLTRQSLQNG